MKSYLRYEPAKQFGVISAPNCNIQYDYTGSLAFTGAIQEVNGWNLRQAAKVKQFSFSEPNYPFRTGGEATVLQASPKSKPLLAVGYSKGTVRLFNYTNEVLVATLHAHRASVSALCFDHEGVTLVSGGADSDIVVWDLVTFTALCRLRGHKDVVTALKMVSLDNDCAAQLGSTRLLVSASKDTLLKVWDVDTQVCVQTVVGHRCEVWALAASSATLSSSSSASEVVLVTGAADNLLRGYRLRARQVQGQDGEGEILEYFGSVERGGEGSEKCAVLCFSAQGDLLAAQSGGKAVELFKVRTPAEVKK
ncbi:WD40-repeat-containing domain protein, partial [Ochromonadaceae sp. CCMP2298]